MCIDSVFPTAPSPAPRLSSWRSEKAEAQKGQSHTQAHTAGEHRAEMTIYKIYLEKPLSQLLLDYFHSAGHVLLAGQEISAMVMTRRVCENEIDEETISLYHMR